MIKVELFENNLIQLKLSGQFQTSTNLHFKAFGNFRSKNEGRKIMVEQLRPKHYGRIVKAE
jgi:hypothetical protein